MKLQHVAAVLAAASFMVLGYTLFDSEALPKYFAMRQRALKLKDQIAQFESRVEEQKIKVNLLIGESSRSKNYLEEVARLEYGFIGKDEVLLRLF